MDSGEGTRALPRVGFPIRTSRDRRLVSISPGLNAAAHVLHRLLAPRHPPCALVLLIVKNTVLPLWSFQGARGHAARREQTTREAGGLSKLNSVLNVEVDVVSRRAPRRTVAGKDESCPPSTTGTPTGVRAPVFPRKEVIQPQLPLRLPCYDFTPVTDPTFDGSLPYGLGHRLRVLPASVV